MAKSGTKTQTSKTKKITKNSTEQKPVEKTKTSRIGAAKQKVSSLLDRLEMAKTFFTFLVIYLPVAWLFLGRGALEETLLVIYTTIMSGVGLWLMFRFVKFFAKSAQSHNGEYGSVFMMYVTNLLQPLIAFKIFGYVIMRMLPHRHDKLPELLCDLFTLIKDLYWNVFQFQNTLNLIIAFTFVVFSLAAVWSVGRKDLK